MAEWKSGQVILGEYTIEKELGRGGMGRVWLVKSSSTGRRFAVKQTLLTEDKHRKAFLAELQTWIDLPEHPNIVPCRFFRTVGDDVLIFSDFADGGSLKNWIDSRRLYEGDQRQSLKRILDVAIQFAWGLHSIHELGLVHQDVKPGNVLMSSGAEAALQGMRVQVSDYGLARARARSGTQGVQATGEGSILLSSGGYTPAYCSPEQAKGLPITRKTDLWSWGVSVLEMFTGGVTWRSGHLAGAVLDQYLEDADESSGIPVMPSALADILRKCFQNDPAQRWANLAAVVAHLKTAYSEITGEDYDRELVQLVHRDTPPAGLTERRTAHGGEWAAPRGWLGRGLILLGRDAEEVTELVQRRGQSRRGQLVADVVVFEEAKQLYLEVVETRPELKAELAELCHDKALVHEAAGDLEGALAEYDQCIAMLRRVIAQDSRSAFNVQLVSAMIGKAVTLHASNAFALCVQQYDECIPMLKQLVQEKKYEELAEQLARACTNRGAALHLLGDLSRAADNYDESIAIWQRLVSMENRQDLACELAKCLLNRATILKSFGDLKGSIESFSRSIVILQTIYERNEGSVADILASGMINKANALSATGDLGSALDLCDKGVTIYRKLIEHEGRQECANGLANALMNKAVVMCQLGDIVKSMNIYDECIAIRRRLVEHEGRGDIAHDLARALMNKAKAKRDVGDLRDAMALYNQCIPIWQSINDNALKGPYIREVIEALTCKISLFSELGDIEGEVKARNELISVYRYTVEQEGRREFAHDLAKALMMNALHLYETGDLTGCRHLSESGIAIWRDLIEQDGKCEHCHDLDMAIEFRVMILNAMGVG